MQTLTSTRFRLSLFVLLGLAAVPAGAQYTEILQDNLSRSAIFPPEQRIPDAESLAESAEEAPWKAGILRLSPWLGIRDARLVTDQRTTDTGSDQPASSRTDFTAAVGAGMRAYIRNGPKVLWAAHALPEYVWWQDATERRRLNGRYGFGLFTHFNRLSFEASHRRLADQRFFSPEVQQLTSSTTDTTRLAAEIEITRPLRVFVDTSKQRYRNEDEERPLLDVLDRDADTLRAGLRLATQKGWSFGLGWEDVSVDFEDSVRDLSNDSQALTFEADFESPKVSLRLRGADRSLDPKPGSLMRATDETTANFEAGVRVGERLLVAAFGRRDLSFAVTDDSSHFLSERVGLRSTFLLRGGERRRLTLNLIAASGEDDFETAGPLPSSPDGGRVDDVTLFAGQLSYDVSRRLRLSLGGQKADYDSNFDEEDREVSSFGLSAILDFTFSAEKLGLRVGSSRDANGW